MSDPDETTPGPHRATFLRGLVGLPRGGVFLARHPRLWPWAALPLLVNVVLFTLLFVVAWQYLLPGLVDWVTPGDLPSWLSWASGWIQPVIRGLVWVVALLLLVVIGAFSFTAIGCVVAAPFLDALSERVENLVLGRSLGVPFSLSAIMEDAARTVLMTLRKLVIVAVVLVVTLPLLVIPVVGQVLFTVLQTVMATWFLATEFVDFPMSRGGWSIPERRAWSGARRAMMFGFGSAVYVVCLIPLMGFLVLPAAVTAAAILFVETTPPGELPDHTTPPGGPGSSPDPAAADETEAPDP